MGCPPSPLSGADSMEGEDFLNLDTEDLVTKIMDHNPHLLDQQDDDMEQLAPYKSALPSAPAAVIHPGPAAAKPVIHIPSAQHRQNAASSSPPLSTRLSSFSHHSSGHQEPFRQEPVSRHGIQKVSADKRPTLSKQHALHRELAPHRQPTGPQSRHQNQSHRSNSAQHDYGLSRQSSEQGIPQHHIELRQKLSDLSLRDQYPSHQAVSDRARRHRSSFVEASPPAQHVEQVEGRSRKLHRLYPHGDFADVPSNSRKADQHSEPAAAADNGSQPDQTSSREWEDEDDEDEYEQVSASQTKRACNGNEPKVSTNQDLKYTSLVWAESSAKMIYLCSRKMYEVMWTSQTAQKLRRSAVHSTKSASSQAADSLGRLVIDSYKRPLGLVKHYVSRRCTVLKASRWSPREAARCSVIRAMRLSRTRMAAVAAPILGSRNEEPESDIEDNWDFCDDFEDETSDIAQISSAQAYDNGGWDAPGLFEDDGFY